MRKSVSSNQNPTVLWFNYLILKHPFWKIHKNHFTNFKISPYKLSYVCNIGRPWELLLLLCALIDGPQWALARIPPTNHLWTLRPLVVTRHRRDTVTQVNERRVFTPWEAGLWQRPVQVEFFFVRFVGVIKHDLSFGRGWAWTPGRRRPSRGGRARAFAAFRTWTTLIFILADLIFLLFFLFLVVGEPRVVKRFILPALVFNWVGDPLWGDYFNPTVPQCTFVFCLGTNQYI